MSPSLRHTVCRAALVALLALGLLAAAAACGGSGAATSPPPADRVAALVDGQPVRASDVAVVRAEERFVGQSDAAGPALKEAIDRELVRRQAARFGASADRAIVDQRLSQLQTQVGGAAALKAMLVRARMSAAQLRQSITDGVLREALQNAQFPKLTASGKAVRAYYRSHLKSTFTRPGSVHLGAIQVHARLIAKNAITRVQQGRPFAEVARQFSVDPESKANGGDLGWILTSSLPGPLRAAVAGAKPGAHRQAARRRDLLVRAGRPRRAPGAGPPVREGARQHRR